MNDDTEVLPRTPTDIEHDDLNSAIAHAAPKRWWNRTTLVLAGLVLLVGGFLGGIQVHKRWGSSSTSSTSSSSAPSGSFSGAFPGGAGLPSGGFGPTGPAAPGTSGTISRIDGNTVYVQTAAGQTVTVRASDTTTVSKTTPATVADLTAGLRVTVQGATDSSGVVSATSITTG
ncbi:hypothetical protein ACWT_2201 [Actinoplanes sp. SE50]|uniref:DUF5666 domain-containing protein n=1 Tax=unclassified Actinoplanes TaxID=2626549 RepID=UPI00023ECC77|nr:MULTISPECIES: DUF5666 domain-containing protein [unclassified Actinoplanes]AEV83221.1 hypothetical protein ACPL_2326 [Actinoplanes sp. SE50/110]ATO81616.1 hypothetical protein ACWT_2201 [Actinoplanes sp. SE50]SLL99024.1 hypothetical protein ACSP50_2252 [Actinoplanes sp. SE50/110]